MIRVNYFLLFFLAACNAFDALPSEDGGTLDGTLDVNADALDAFLDVTSDASNDATVDGDSISPPVPQESVQTALIRSAALTTSGIQTIEQPGFGIPKAAIVIISRATADGSIADHAVLGIGATDGNTQFAISGRSRDASSSSATHRWGSTDYLVQIIEPTAETLEARGVFNGWSENGMHIDWQLAPSNAYMMTVIFFAGTELDAEVIDFSTNNTQNASVDATTGFTPDQLFVFSHARGEGANSAHHISLGVVDRQPGWIDQAALVWLARHGQTTSTIFTRTSASRAALQLANNNPDNLQASFEVTAFRSTPTSGFTVTTRDGTPNPGVKLYVLALAFNAAVSHGAGMADVPASPGNFSFDAPGFRPQFVMQFTHNASMVDDPAMSGMLGISAFTPDAASSHGMTYNNGVSGASAKNIVDDIATNLPRENGSAGFMANFVSMDPDGWTLNFTNTMGSTRQWPSIAIGEVP